MVGAQFYIGRGSIVTAKAQPKLALAGRVTRFAPMQTFRALVNVVAIAGAMSAAAIGSAAERRPTNAIEIPYTKYVLSNGLTLIVHEDHKAPIVAVNVWYHVGSKNEKPGKTGFAHLFEHLMFNGSENFDDDYFKAMEKVGATDLNGTTSEDRTNYFENAPEDALDLLLWMESDRMGNLLGAVTQAKLDEQRGVVQNEKRQGDNQPYAIAWELIQKNTWPANHPYSWRVIGSMEDLNAASLEDVKEWFRTYYGAANAVLTIAGDVKPEEVRAKVEKYFGWIPPGPPVARHDAWVAKRTGTHRQRAEDRVPQARIFKVWNIPQYGTHEGNLLNLVSDVLSQGKSSRFYKRLVYQDQIATDAQAYVELSEIGGQFGIVATARPGEDLAKVEKALDEELAKFIKDGPTRDELERAKTQFEAGFVRGIERIGGFGGKSDILAHNFVFTGRPDYYKQQLEETRQATAKELQRAAREWLSDGAYVLEVHPFPSYAAAGKDVERKTVPYPDLQPEVKFPAMQRTQLANGLKIILAERHAIPTVQFNLMFDAGFAADSLAAAGTARLAMNMLDEGTRSRDTIEISDDLARLGATLSTAADLDSCYASMSALKSKLDESLGVYADVVLNPSFPEDEFKRLQQQTLAAIQREKAEPTTMALRVFPGLLYGKEHAYGNPFTGSGTEESVRAMTTADLRKFYDTWMKPNNATMVVVGDTTLAEIAPKIEKLFRDWKKAEVPQKNVARLDKSAAKAGVYIIDRPGSVQSIIFAGELAPPKNNPDEIAIETMNSVLGGTFTSRINMNLREDKHWSYGSRSFLSSARGQRPFLVMAPVQTDKTRESLVEVMKELSGVLKDKPVTPDELKKAQVNQTLRLPGAWETAGSVASSISEIVRFNLPADYFQTYPDKVRALTQEQIAAAAKTIIHPDKLVWVVVGDRAKIESGIRELNMGDVHLLDVNGQPVK
jgi:zinc protease